jgi:hypothetical protein
MMFALLVFLGPLLAGAGTGLQVYYHVHGRLFVGDQAVAVEWRDAAFPLNTGSVSPTGRFVCGILLTSYWSDRIEAEEGPGIVDFFGVDSCTFVVAERLTSKVLWATDNLSFVPEGLFSPDERSLYISGFPDRVVRVSDGKTLMSCSDLVSEARWFAADLHYVVLGDSVVNHMAYDCAGNTERSVQVFARRSFQDATYDHYYILDESTVLEVRNSSKQASYRVFRGGDMIFDTTWSSSQVYGAGGSGVMVFGEPLGAPGRDVGLFTFDANTFRFDRILSRECMRDELFYWSSPIDILTADSVLFLLFAEPGDVARIMMFHRQDDSFETYRSADGLGGPVGLIQAR